MFHFIISAIYIKKETYFALLYFWTFAQCVLRSLRTYAECCQKTAIPIISISDCGKLSRTFGQAAGQTTTTGQVSSIYYLPTFIWPNQIEYVFTIQFYL